MERMRVVSSNVEWLEYSGETKALKVGFKNGSIYRFDGVPAEVANGFAVPDISIGRYFSANIRGRYPYERLPPEVAEEDRQKDQQIIQPEAV